jgi:hypothetical protein
MPEKLKRDFENLLSTLAEPLRVRVEDSAICNARDTAKDCGHKGNPEIWSLYWDTAYFTAVECLANKSSYFPDLT